MSDPTFATDLVKSVESEISASPELQDSFVVTGATVTETPVIKEEKPEPVQAPTPVEKSTPAPKKEEAPK